MSMYQNILDGKYLNNKPFETRKKDPVVYDEYVKEGAKLLHMFMTDIEEEFGVKGNPKAKLLWEKAWAMGHSSGFYEIYNVYSDLVELIK